MANDRSRRWKEKGKVRQAALKTVQLIGLPQPSTLPQPIISRPLPTRAPMSPSIRMALLPAPPPPASTIISVGNLPLPVMARPLVRTSSPLPSLPVQAVGIDVLPLPTFAGRSNKVVPHAARPTPVLTQPRSPLQAPGPLPQASNNDVATNVFSLPAVSISVAVPVKVKSKLPVAPMPVAKVHANPRFLELLELFSRKEQEEELSAKRKKKAGIVRQQLPPDLGHSR